MAARALARYRLRCLMAVVSLFLALVRQIRQLFHNAIDLLIRALSQMLRVGPLLLKERSSTTTRPRDMTRPTVPSAPHDATKR